jgi:hypothetical protein
MQHTLTELTAILGELIGNNGTAAVVNCLQDALCIHATRAYNEWENVETRDALVKEWRRQAAAVSRAVQEIG